MNPWVQALIAAGKTAVDVTPQILNYVDVKKTLQERKAQLESQIVAEEFFGEQTAQAAIADYNAASGSINAAAAVAGVSGGSVSAIQGTQSNVFAMESVNRAVSQSLYMSSLKSGRAALLREERAQRRQLAFGVTGSLLSNFNSGVMPMMGGGSTGTSGGKS